MLWCHIIFLASFLDDAVACPWDIHAMGAREEKKEGGYPPLLPYWCPFINLVSKARQVINIAATLDK